MASEETYLFIGGPMDGERLSVLYGESSITVPNPEVCYVDDFGSPCSTESPEWFKNARCETVRYRRERIFGTRQQFHIFVLEGMDFDEVVLRLLASYSPKKLEPSTTA